MDTNDEDISSIYDGLQSRGPSSNLWAHIWHWDPCVTLSSERNEVSVIITFDLTTNLENWELDLSWQNIFIPDPDL